MLSRYRIKKELSDIKKYKEENNIEEWGAEPVNEDNYYYWEAYVIGPEDTPYEGGKFRIKINFPYDYPENPFKIRFLTKIYHPFISEEGEIHCCDFPNFYADTLPGSWTRNFTLHKAIEEIRDKLKNFKINCGYINREATEMFQKNREKFNKIAKDWTEKYAILDNVTFSEFRKMEQLEKEKMEKKKQEEVNDIKNIYKNIFGNQISQLKEMGFNNEDMVIDILYQCDGDVDRALNILTGFN